MVVQLLIDKTVFLAMLSSWRRVSLLTTMLLLLTVQAPVVALFDWFFDTSKLAVDVEDSRPAESKTLSPQQYPLLARVPFELNAVDERFLETAAEFSNTRLSQLDVCHQKIIISLTKSCVHLSEEEISKLSVNLFNCQSAVEGRTIYPCRSDMTLKDCTKNMDQDTWNAYHIISNRARAVCYSTRQVQFRAKTEMTINKLVTTAEEQVLVMSALQDEQEKLGAMTHNTLKTISTGHENLLQQQNILKNAQQNMQHYVASNLRDLTREKALIADGQKELAEMKESIKENLDVAKSQLADHQEDRERSHLKILNDLSDMQTKARLLWEKIDNSTRKILKQHEDASVHYHESLRNLQRVNDSINYLLQLVERMKGEIEGKLNWLAHIAGGTGVQMSVITTVVLHFGYFFFCAVAAAFVNAPTLTRVALLVLVPLNALGEVNNVKSADFLCLTFAIVASAILHYALKIAHRAISAVYFRETLTVDSSISCNGQRELLEPQKHGRHSRIQRRGAVPRLRSDGSDDESSCTKHRNEVTPPSGIVSALLGSVRKIACSAVSKDQRVSPDHQLSYGGRAKLGYDSSSSCDNYQTISPNSAMFSERPPELLKMIRRSARVHVQKNA